MPVWHMSGQSLTLCGPTAGHSPSTDGLRPICRDPPPFLRLLSLPELTPAPRETLLFIAFSFGDYDQTVMLITECHARIKTRRGALLQAQQPVLLDRLTPSLPGLSSSLRHLFPPANLSSDRGHAGSQGSSGRRQFHRSTCPAT